MFCFVQTAIRKFTVELDIKKIRFLKITTAIRIIIILSCLIISGFTTTVNYIPETNVNTQQVI